MVLPEGPSLGKTEDNACPPRRAPRRETVLRLGPRAAEKKQKRKLILRVEAAVVLSCGQSGDGVHVQEEEHCQAENQTQAGKEEAFKKLQQVREVGQPFSPRPEPGAPHRVTGIERLTLGDPRTDVYLVTISSLVGACQW